MFNDLISSSLLSTDCSSAGCMELCNYLHLTVSLLEPPTFPAPEWEDSILPHHCDWWDYKHTYIVHSIHHSPDNFQPPSLH